MYIERAETQEIDDSLCCQRNKNWWENMELYRHLHSLNFRIKTIYISMELFPRGYRLLIKGEATSAITQSESWYVEERVNIYTLTVSRRQWRSIRRADRTGIGPIWSGLLKDGEQPSRGEHLYPNGQSMAVDFISPDYDSERQTFILTKKD